MATATRTRRATAILLALAGVLVAAFALAGDAAKPLSVDSTVGELLDNAPARAVLQRLVPPIVNSPQIEQARGLSLRALKTYSPALLSDEVLLAIDTELAKTPGAVESGIAVRRQPAPVDPRDALQLKTMPLWEGRAPDAHGDDWQDIPTLTLIGTDGTPANGTAIVVAPGGGYQSLATGHEGRQVGEWFAARGITAFVLSYRLASLGYRHPVQLHDAQRAIRWVRAHAADYGIDASRIGMIGFSAGGHLTAMTSTLFDDGNPQAADPVERLSSRPDFAILGYAAIVAEKGRWTQLGLLDRKASRTALREITPASNVSARTPPTFIFHTSTDELLSPANPISYYEALQAARVPVEMHIFEEGRHGQGFALYDPALGMWPVLLERWLAKRGLLGEVAGAFPGRAR